MEKRQSMWHSLGRGIVWGGLVAVLTAPVYLVLFILAWNIESMLYGLGLDPVVYGIGHIWVVIFYYGFRILAIPSVVGGGIVALVLHCLARRGLRVGRYGLWVGAIVGGAVASSYMLYWSFRLGGFQWTLGILVCMMEMTAFGWLGRHLALRHQGAE